MGGNTASTICRSEAEDGRQKTGDGRRETGDGRRETGEERASLETRGPVPAADGNRCHAAGSEDIADKGVLVENREGGGIFAGAQKPGRDAELVLNGYGDSAFAGTVEFGDDQAI